MILTGDEYLERQDFEGGSAFPGAHVHVVGDAGPEGRPVPRHDPGMTLLDWFAGQALAGILANSRGAPQTVDGAKELPEACYRVARAMLEEREAVLDARKSDNVPSGDFYSDGKGFSI